MMPDVPATDLIVRETAFAFRIAEAVLDEEALRLYPCQFEKRCIGKRRVEVLDYGRVRTVASE